MQNQSSPLAGKTILITRPGEQSEVFVDKLERLGARVLNLPSIEIVPPRDYSSMDNAIENLNSFDWVIFTSINGVKFFTGRMQEKGMEPALLNSKKIAAIGPATAKGLQDLGIEVSFIPQIYVAEYIASEIGDVKGKKILLPRADIARENLKVLLTEKGAEIVEVAAYHTVASSVGAEEFKNAVQQGLDIITFTSSSTVKYFHERAEKIEFNATSVKIACIGPITAKTAMDLGYEVWLTAEPHTIDGLIDSMLDKLSLEKINN